MLAISIYYYMLCCGYFLAYYLECLIYKHFPVADGNVDKVHVMNVGIYSDSPNTFEYGEGESAQTLWPPGKYPYRWM